MAATTALYMFPILFMLLLLGVPVAFAMLLTAITFGWMVYDQVLIFQLLEKISDTGTNYVLATVPLFVFMGCMLERAGIAKQLFEAMHMWTRRLPGGMAIGTVCMCVVFAASTGVVGATEIVVGLLAMPAMLQHKYDKGLIAGTICAGGSLGAVIPPSIIVIIMGPLADVSVGDLLVGMLFPGLIMASLYIAYIWIRCTLQPSAGPVDLSPDTMSLGEKLRITAYALLPPVFLITAVLGSIMLGFASPTEAAALGALGSLFLAAIYGKFSMSALHGAMMKTLLITAMIMTIVLAGSILTGVFISTGGSRLARDFVAASGLSPWMLLAFILLIAFLAGAFLDWISVVLIMIPIFTPIVVELGFDPVWFCIAFLIVIQTSYLTPPMAPAVFYLRGIAPPEMTTMIMYRGNIPFIGLQLLTLVLVLIFPQLVLWLPSRMMGF